MNHRTEKVSGRYKYNYYKNYRYKSNDYLCGVYRFLLYELYFF